MKNSSWTSMVKNHILTLATCPISSVVALSFGNWENIFSILEMRLSMLRLAWGWPCGKWNFGMLSLSTVVTGSSVLSLAWEDTGVNSYQKILANANMTELFQHLMRLTGSVLQTQSSPPRHLEGNQQKVTTPILIMCNLYSWWVGWMFLLSDRLKCKTSKAICTCEDC